MTTLYMSTSNNLAKRAFYETIVIFNIADNKIKIYIP